MGLDVVVYEDTLCVEGLLFGLKLVGALSSNLDYISSISQKVNNVFKGGHV